MLSKINEYDILPPGHEANSKNAAVITPHATDKTYELNSAVLPLQINFNPLLVTYCLFLRMLTDLVTTDDANRLAEYCLA